jgi:hypothetical protein
MKITFKTSLTELAAIVSTALTEAGLEAVLSGGSVVTIYSDNEYQSQDLDFVTPEKMKDLTAVMMVLGFEKQSRRHFTHPNSEWFVEFPSAPLAVGNEPVRKWDQLKTGVGIIQILSPTQSVMDRLAEYYAWKDKKNFEQAVMIAVRHPIDISKIKSWSKAENELEKFDHFVEAVKKRKSSR